MINNAFPQYIIINNNVLQNIKKNSKHWDIFKRTCIHFNTNNTHIKELGKIYLFVLILLNNLTINDK